MTKNTQIGFLVTMISISATACGVLLCLAVLILTEIFDCNYSATTYFSAYVSGSVGFLLSAPVNLFLHIQRKHPKNTVVTVTVWFIITLVIFLLACMIGVVFMVVFKWMYGTYNPSDMATQFISGAFLLFVCGGINWLFNRKRTLQA